MSNTFKMSGIFRFRSVRHFFQDIYFSDVRHFQSVGHLSLSKCAAFFQDIYYSDVRHFQSVGHLSFSKSVTFFSRHILFRCQTLSKCRTSFIFEKCDIFFKTYTFQMLDTFKVMDNFHFRSVRHLFQDLYYSDVRHFQNVVHLSFSKFAT